MSGKLAFCIVGSLQQAEAALHRLESERFSDDRISVIFPDKGVLPLPGIGPFIASGPIVGALRAAAAHAGSGGIAIGLVGLGLIGTDARRIQGKVEEGNFLLSVHAATAGEVARAMAIFAAIGAEDICSPGEGRVPA